MPVEAPDEVQRGQEHDGDLEGRARVFLDVAYRLRQRRQEQEHVDQHVHVDVPHRGFGRGVVGGGGGGGGGGVGVGCEWIGWGGWRGSG